MKIVLRDCENGALQGGIKITGQLSKSPTRRIDYAKIARRLEKAMTEPLAEWQDIVREFNTENEGQGVVEIKMTKERLAEWRAKSKEWREHEVDFDFYPGGGTSLPIDGKLEIKLGRRSLASIPEQILEGMVDYCTFIEDETETKEEGLEEVIKKMRADLDALQKEAKK